MAQQRNPAQGLLDDYAKVEGWLGKTTKKAPTGSSTDVGKLPDAWEEANKRAIAQHKLADRKPLGSKKKATAKRRRKSSPRKRD